MRISSLVMMLLAYGCGEKIENLPNTEDSGTMDTGTDVIETNDVDGDGWTVADGDCDDQNASVYPGGEELCDGADNNCNTTIDEGFSDVDGDGIADCVDTEECDGMDNDGDGDIDEGFSDVDGDDEADCVDIEECDGIDNNNDGQIDEGFDQDGDGFSTCRTALLDCNDNDASIYPNASEDMSNGIDDDCDGIADEDDSVYVPGSLVISEIMNNPAAVADNKGEWFEIYNASEVDINLNGLIISDMDGIEIHRIEANYPLTVLAKGYIVVGNNAVQITNGGVAVSYQYSDISLSNESDSLLLKFGETILDSVMWDNGATMPDPNGISMQVDPGFLEPNENDTPSAWCITSSSPGMMNSSCPNVDRDGDGVAGTDGDCDDSDPNVYPGAALLEDPTACMMDADGDGYGDANPSNPAITPGMDCDDSTIQASPVAAFNESVSACMIDVDGDGYGDANPSNPAITAGTDCDDTQAAIYPLDNDGDGATMCDSDCDDNDPNVFPGAASLESLTACMEDADGDGWGSMTPVNTLATAGTDCDDTHASAFPGAAELQSSTACMLDADGDGHGHDNPSNSAITAGDDCNDSHPSVFTGNAETVGDGLDNNCDGVIE